MEWRGCRGGKENSGVCHAGGPFVAFECGGLFFHPLSFACAGSWRVRSISCTVLGSLLVGERMRLVDSVDVLGAGF